jgi:hypothetical protein
VRHILRLLVVGLLMFSASGVSALAVDDACSLFEQSAGSDRDCPPTCVTCGCCAQAVEPGTFIVSLSLRVPAARPSAEPVRFPTTDPLDVLHVPKRLSA